MTTPAAFEQFKKQIEQIYDERESEQIADWIFEHVTGKKRWQRRHSTEALNADEQQTLDAYMVQLMQHRPVQYILNEAWFYKRKFYVDERVLIPRPETEELVAWIINEQQHRPQLTIIDIGTGSGCIAISLKLELPNAAVSAIDKSTEALRVATHNADALNADVQFEQNDFLAEGTWSLPGKTDVIVSNPPYIPASGAVDMDKNVTGYEPELALFVADDDPFIFYKKIAAFGLQKLSTHGCIYVEIHEGSAEEVTAIFTGMGYKVDVKNDIYGKERMIKAQLI